MSEWLEEIACMVIGGGGMLLILFGGAWCLNWLFLRWMG